MSDSTVVVGNDQRKMLEGLEDDILNLVTSQANLPTKVWEVWLRVPYERACACGDDKLASILHKAGAKGNGLHHAARGGHRGVILGPHLTPACMASAGYIEHSTATTARRSEITSAARQCKAIRSET